MKDHFWPHAAVSLRVRQRDDHKERKGLWGLWSHAYSPKVMFPARLRRDEAGCVGSRRENIWNHAKQKRLPRKLRNKIWIRWKQTVMWPLVLLVWLWLHWWLVSLVLLLNYWILSDFKWCVLMRTTITRPAPAAHLTNAYDYCHKWSTFPVCFTLDVHGGKIADIL